MSSRQCVKDAIAHRPSDRVPYCIGFCQDGADALKEHLGREDLGAYVDDDVARVGIPWWTWHELEADWRGCDVPTSPATVVGTGPSYSDCIETIQRRSAEDGKYVLVMVYGSHWEKAYFSRGIENFLADMAGEPAFAQALLDRIIEKNLVMLENILHIPEVDGVLLGSDWGTQCDLIMSPSTWEEMIRPGEQREYDLIHSYGKDVWIHSCGNVEKILPSLVEMGVDVLNPLQPECMDIAAIKAAYGEELAFWGGISTQQTLPFGTPQAVRDEARAVRVLLSRGGGYIFSPAQELQGDVPPENMVALIEVAQETRVPAGAGT